MTRRATKGPSRATMGCVTLVVLGMGACGVMGLSTSRSLIQFRRFEQTTPGTPLTRVVDEAGTLGFRPREAGAEGPDDAGLMTLELVKQNWPPVGPWHLRVKHADGGVASVTTWIPD
ncbi:MAG: hypothetical protein IAE78_20905 [Myxococcus sp.]|nr:hypothetical protein [Myxococcus sp.]